MRLDETHIKGFREGEMQPVCFDGRFPFIPKYGSNLMIEQPNDLLNSALLPGSFPIYIRALSCERSKMASTIQPTSQDGGGNHGEAQACDNLGFITDPRQQSTTSSTKRQNRKKTLSAAAITFLQSPHRLWDTPT